jgi:hypothetical protein
MVYGPTVFVYEKQDKGKAWARGGRGLNWQLQLCRLVDLHQPRTIVRTSVATVDFPFYFACVHVWARVLSERHPRGDRSHTLLLLTSVS